MKRLILGILALMLIVGFSGCNDSKSLDGLIKDFKEHKINGHFSQNAFGMIGAINGGTYTNNDSSVSMEIYEWKDSSDVKMTPYKNGRFGMILYAPKTSSKQYKKIVDIFKDY